MEVSRNNIATLLIPSKRRSPALLKVSELFFLSFPQSSPTSSSIRRMLLTASGFGFGAGSGRSNVFDPFSVEPWDPLQGFPFHSFPRFGCEASTLLASRIDWRETPEAHVFKVDLPGLRKEEIKVEVDDGRVLKISGERNHEHVEKTDTWHRVERSSGKFLRKFRLPENVKMDQVMGAVENGVLTVTVPKDSVKKNSPKSIEISG